MQQEASRQKKRYSFGEEVFNAVSHGVGAVLSLVAGTVVVTLAILRGGAVHIAAMSIYGASLVVMYTMSTLYHAFPFEKAKQLFRVFDHSSIPILIAGTYTPYMLITLGGQRIGLVIFLCVWALAIVNIALNCVNLEAFEKVGLALHVAMGWCIVVAIKPVIAALPRPGLWLLVLGGVSYTAGIFFYLSRRRYMHAVWHIFVLLGSGLHYASIIAYVLLSSTRP